jgi:hypothetical protein
MQNEPQVLADALEFVALGYGDLTRGRFFRSLNFRTDLLTTRQAQAVVRLVKTHNAFAGDPVARGLERFYRRVRGYEFGRESSPVLYVLLPYTENQIEEQGSATVGPRISEASHEQVLLELHQTFKDLGAEEVSVEGEYRHTVRAWWG